MTNRTSYSGTHAALALLLAFGCSRTSGGPQSSDTAEARADGPTGNSDSAADDSSAQQVSAGPHHRMGPMGEACPVARGDVDVTAVDTEGGIALTFETSKDADIEDLRRRATAMAEMYQRHATGPMSWHRMGPGAGMGPGMGPGTGMGPGMGMGRGGGPRGGGGPLPEVAASVENTDRGARILLTPKTPTELDLLRDRVRHHAERMSQHECWQPQPATAGAGSSPEPAAPAPTTGN